MNSSYEFIKSPLVQSAAEGMLNTLMSSHMDEIDGYIEKHAGYVSSPETILNELSEDIQIPKAANEAGKSPKEIKREAMGKAQAFLVTSMTSFGFSAVFMKALMNEVAGVSSNASIMPKFTNERIAVSLLISLGLSILSLMIYYRSLAKGQEELMKATPQPSNQNDSNAGKQTLKDLPKNIRRITFDTTREIEFEV